MGLLLPSATHRVLSSAPKIHPKIRGILKTLLSKSNVCPLAKITFHIAYDWYLFTYGNLKKYRYFHYVVQ
jgi:hypothetical protein